MDPSLPLFFYMTGRRALVVGGGRAAMFKIRALLRSGAHVTVIAPQLSPSVRTLVHSSDRVVYLARKAVPQDVRTCFTLFFPLTDDESINTKLTHVARRKRIWVGGSSNPTKADFSFAATVDRGPIRLAISTGGASPALARLLAQRLGEFLERTVVSPDLSPAPARKVLRQTPSKVNKRREILAKAARGFIKK